MNGKLSLRQSLEKRVLLLDGAMGTQILEFHLAEEDFRGEKFAQSKVQLKGNNDVLNLTRPDVVRQIHRRYLEAGADLITTNTFSSQRISQAEYGLTDEIHELNIQGALIAREEADRMTAIDPARPRYVLGDVGPTSQMLSMSSDSDNPASRTLTFDAMEEAFYEQMFALVEGGVDAILLETIFDTLNAKAAVSAYEKVKAATGCDVPLMCSATVSDKSGRMLSGQTMEAFVVSMAHANPLSVGMNCGLGAAAMIPLLHRMQQAVVQHPDLSCHGEVFLSCHPNAGLPNQFGCYDDTPEEMAEEMRPLLADGIARIVGGCCGTTPAHIAAMRREMDSTEAVPRVAPNTVPTLTLSGQDAFSFAPDTFVVVGERCNVAGSRKFLRLINEGQYDEALDIARTQIEKGAMVIDINMDDGLLDASREMTTFLNLIASDPSVCRVPIMVDSSRFDVIEAGLKCCQGKCIVNSISLKQGEEEFLRQARIVRRLGAAVVVMCFDEQGQATTYERRIGICERAYRLLTEQVGLPASDIIFDPNILTIATGMAEHANYARDFIRATEWITRHLPGCRVSGGLSNLSFAFRGNNYLREAMHAVFLHHARAVGMGMAIMNPATALRYEDIDPALRDTLSAVIMNTRDSATEELMQMKDVANSDVKKTDTTSPKTTVQEPVSDSAEERLSRALLQGATAGLEADLQQLTDEGKTPLQIISGPLMQGMTEVGRRFGEGQMFLPQVVRTARTMKKAVEILSPLMQATQHADWSSAGRVVLATVKGDVHDIGKNIVGVVLSCNGFQVTDLGEMVPAERIVQEAVDGCADIVCLSGLITPSLEEMCHVARCMQQAGLRIPLFVGGATTSAVHTAVRIAPLYQGGVFHMKDASQDPVVAMQLMDPAKRQEVLRGNELEQQRIRMVFRRREEGRRRLETEIAHDNAAVCPFTCQWETYTPVRPPFVGSGNVRFIPLADLLPHIDWLYFYWAWRVKADSDEGRLLRADADRLLTELVADASCGIQTLQSFYPARNHQGQGIVVNESLIPTPRQELLAPDGTPRSQCLSLCDFVSPLGNDYVGLFACTISPAMLARLERLKQSGADDYEALLMQTVCDRLAEAASAFLSDILQRETGWGGIRPAVGYPSLPDQKSIFALARWLDFDALGIRLTENGAMYPQSSVCGLYISHPESCYFKVDA